MRLKGGGAEQGDRAGAGKGLAPLRYKGRSVITQFLRK